MTALALTKEAHVIHSAAGLQVDEATRPELVDFGTKVLRSENVRQNSRGANEKRNGFVALANVRLDGTSPSAGYKMFADGQSVIRITDSMQVETFSMKAQAWSPLNRAPEATARLIDVPSMGVSTNLEDVDSTNGYIAVSWMSLATQPSVAFVSYLSILDAASGAVVRAPEAISTSTGATYLGVQGNYFIAVQSGTTAGQLIAYYLDTTSSATLSTGWVQFASPIATNGTAFYVIHSLPHATTPRVAVFYLNTIGGTTRLSLVTINVASGVVQTRNVATNNVTIDNFAIGGASTDTLWITWNEGTIIFVQGVSPFTISTDLATKASVIVMTSGCAYLGICQSATAGRCRIWSSDTSTVPRGQTVGVHTTAGAAVADGVQLPVVGLQMCRKPALINGRHYSGFYNADGGVGFNGQNNFFVCDWTDQIEYVRPVANPAPALASVGLNGFGKFAPTSGTTVIVGFGIHRSAVANGSTLLELDFANAQRLQAVAHAGTTALTAAVPAYFDGLRVAELGFLYRPVTPTTTAIAGALTATTGYRYVAIYEETDGDGNWCVSGVSNPSAITGALTTKNVVATTLPISASYRVTSSGAQRGVRVAFYRTLDGGNPPYYRVSSVINNLSSGTSVSITDSTTDASLAQNAQLYEQPSVQGTSQDRRPPPSFQALVSYNGMLVGASGSDVWYSGQNVIGEAVWFNPIFQVPIPGDGPITALAVLDGTLFVFKRREVYSVVGDPPADNGSSGGLGAPRRIASDVGCIEPRSTCATSLGIFFQSDRGIEILTRAQSTEWIGEPYTNTVSAFPICTSITVEPVSNTALVELAASQSSGAATGGGCTLVYDLSLKQWVSKDIRLTTGVAAQSACIVTTTNGPRYGWMSAAGQVYTETPNLSLDAGAWVTSLIETASVRHGLQQRQRVWGVMALFEHAAAAGLQVEIAYDYAGYSETKAWTEAETLSGLRQLEFRPKSEHAAIRFRISDTAPAVLGTGQGLTLIGLSVDAALKQGATKGTPHLSPTLRK